MATPISLVELERTIREEWCAETAWSPQRWTLSSPAAGQCFSTAYVVMELLGGEVVHAEVLPHTEPKQRHSWNRLPGGFELDLTREQFPPGQQFAVCVLPESLVWEHGGRQAALLLQRVAKRLGLPLRMEPDFHIMTVDHRTLPMARQLHAVQMRAYAQEAQWLGAVYFPPLERTVAEVGASTETFLAAFVESEIVGAVSVLPDDEDMGVNIASLVVDPPFQQQGIGRALVAAVVQAHEGKDLTVQTGVKNLPALSLYRQFGFVELRRWFVGPEPLELTKLRRRASPGLPWPLISTGCQRPTPPAER